MAYTADLFNMFVVVPGSSVVVEDTYKGDGSTTMKKGDVIRINTSGQIVDAAVNTDTTGPVHGMVLTDDYKDTAATTSQYIPILKFGSDTILATQIYNATGSDAEPQDLSVGTSYTLRNSAAGIWCITTTTTKGIALVAAKPGESSLWFDDTRYGVGADWGVVYIRFIQSLLDAHGS